jgi:hypothetical protein
VIKLLVITPLRDLSRQQSVASQRGPVRDPDHLDGVVDPAFVRREERAACRMTGRDTRWRTMAGNVLSVCPLFT